MLGWIMLCNARLDTVRLHFIRQGLDSVISCHPALKLGPKGHEFNHICSYRCNQSPMYVCLCPMTLIYYFLSMKGTNNQKAHLFHPLGWDTSESVMLHYFIFLHQILRFFNIKTFTFFRYI